MQDAVANLDQLRLAFAMEGIGAARESHEQRVATVSGNGSKGSPLGIRTIILCIRTRAATDSAAQLRVEYGEFIVLLVQLFLATQATRDFVDWFLTQQILREFGPRHLSCAWLGCRGHSTTGEHQLWYAGGEGAFL